MEMNSGILSEIGMIGMDLFFQMGDIMSHAFHV
jgi:hypothetical protein